MEVEAFEAPTDSVDLCSMILAGINRSLIRCHRHLFGQLLINPVEAFSGGMHFYLSYCGEHEC